MSSPYDNQMIQGMLVGAQKAGTTSLFRYIAQHPDITTHLQSEMAYFLEDHEYQRGYPVAFVRFFGRSTPKSFIFAKHVMLMYSEIAISRLYQHNPSVKLLVVLRNPIERAYSAYWYARKMGWETLPTFEQALLAENDRLKQDGWKEWRQCAYLHNGLYEEALQKIDRYFEKGLVQVFLTEELKSNILQICQNAFAHLGLDEAFQPDFGQRYNQSASARSEVMARVVKNIIASRAPLNQLLRKTLPSTLLYRARTLILSLNQKQFTPPPMLEQTRDWLLHYYEPHNQRLSEYLGRDLGVWNR